MVLVREQFDKGCHWRKILSSVRAEVVTLCLIGMPKKTLIRHRLRRLYKRFLWDARYKTTRRRLVSFIFITLYTLLKVDMALEGIRIKASQRGMEVGLKYAEAFEVIRDVKM